MSKTKKPSGGARLGGALHRVTGRREACLSNFYSENEKVWRQMREPILICVTLRA